MYDEMHLKGNFKTLLEDDEPFLQWREFLSRDTRAFLTMDDVMRVRYDDVKEDEKHTTNIVDNQWM